MKAFNFWDYLKEKGYEHPIFDGEKVLVKWINESLLYTAFDFKDEQNGKVAMDTGCKISTIPIPKTQRIADNVLKFIDKNTANGNENRI